MEKFDDIDNAFRRTLEGFEHPPVPEAWGNVKQKIIENKLVLLARQNLILKGTTLGLLLLLLPLLWTTFFKNKKEITYLSSPEKRTIDTVFVQKMTVKYDTVYVEKLASPVIVYVPIEPQNNNIESSSKNEFAEIGKLTKPTETTAQLPNKIETQVVDNERNGSIKDLLELEKITNRDSTVWLDTHKKFGKINYELPFKMLRNLSKSEEKIAFIERVFIQPSVGLSNNKLKVLRLDEILPSSYQKGTSAELSVGIEMNKGWAFRTGISYQKSNFLVNDVKKQVIRAENLAGQPTFVYRTPFGNAIIPAAELSQPPSLDGYLTVEAEEGATTVTYGQIPLLLQYDFLEKQLRLFDGRRSLNFYLFGGGNLTFPLKKSLFVEIYEADGYDFYTTLTNIRGVNNLSFGSTFGLGSKVKMSYRTSFFVEGSLYKNFTPMVSNEYYKSTLQGGGLRLGFYHSLK